MTLHVLSDQQLVAGKIKNLTETGVDVELEPSGVTAFVPRIHLSDSLEGCDLLMEYYRPGIHLKNLVYLSKTGVLVSLQTLKA